MLKTSNHSRDSAGMTYVYPVVSRRARGISIGINLNPNNACNWRCIYCQVPNLKRGSAPDIDLTLLDQELSQLLSEIVRGSFFEHFEVSPEFRQIRDIAISGNGEPTTCEQFSEVIEIIGKAIREYELAEKISLVLITNGSQMEKKRVQIGLKAFSKMGGVVWFKVDGVNETETALINDIKVTEDRIAARLEVCASLCRTWIQHCCFILDGKAPTVSKQNNFLYFLKERVITGVKIEGVQLYGLARPSMQPESSRLERLSDVWMAEYASSIESLGFNVVRAV